MQVYYQTKEEVMERYESSQNGLTREQAGDRLERDGRNELDKPKKKSLLRRFLEQLKNPMTIILVIAAMITMTLAVIEHESFVDGIIILSVVVVNAILGVYQESKAEDAIDALQSMTPLKTNVVRDGVVQVIESSALVVGDVILLEAGDQIPADARILESASLKVEESALTGESVPVDKNSDVLARDTDKDIPLAERHNMLFMGNTIVYGRGKAIVSETGMRTQVGKIAGALQNASDRSTPLQMKLAQLSKILTWLVLGVCMVVFGVQVLQAGSLQFDVVMNSFLIAVSLAVAAIPEGLAAVVTVVLSMGVTKMSKNRAIIRKLTAVETLGCTQIICTDKTGTLTQNKMTVTDFYTTDKVQLAKGMALCSDAVLQEDDSVTGEPTEAALVAWANTMQLRKEELEKELPRVGELPFDAGRKMMSTFHQDGSKIIQFTKGAPDIILQHCTYYLEDGIQKELTQAKKQEILQANKTMADRALRVLACGQKQHDRLPDMKVEHHLEDGLCFVGLCGMIDPVRPEVKDAIVKCQEAGIRPIMITGDHVDTAVAIAKSLSLFHEGDIAMTGTMLDALSEEEFAQKLSSISVYARVQPEHKTRIVNAWKKAGYVTAMTGDGVNDAPSIKEADIGIGMGITGTDVTKNVADMILADDNFATIVSASEEGRRIYDNIRKAIQFLLGSNMSEVLAIFFSSLLGFTILKPVHLLWINLVTDTFPALALGNEAGEADIMKRKPREMKEGIFAHGMGFDIVYQGILVTGLVFVSYLIGHYMETGLWQFSDSADGMTMAFLTLSMAEIFHSFNMRSQRNSLFQLKTHNHGLWIGAIVSIVMTTIVCEVEIFANAFGFTSVSMMEYLIALGLGFLMIPCVEIVKLIQRMTHK